MPVVVVRIDDRLIHGQIVQGWLKSININKIVVASDSVADDAMQQMLMSMAVPSGVELDIKKVSEAADAFIKGDYDKENTMILVSNPACVLCMIDKGANIKSVNVGGMHFVHGKRQLLCNLSVDDNDVKNLYEIYSRGVEIEGRILPEDERSNLVSLIEKEREKCR